MFSYGFYNSLNGDRKYNAEQMSSIFDGVIVDGIFENVGEIFATVPGAGLEVIVKTGRAWFKHTWSLNDSWMPLAISEADVYRTRIDAVVLEVNHDINVRKNEIKIVEGEPAVVGVKPTMIHNENVDQYALAYVTVPPMTTSILESNIEIMVGRGDTPFVTCPLKTIPITDLFNQWNGEFSTWFNSLKAQLTDNVVTNLQSQITANKTQIESVQSTLDGSLPLITDGMGAGSLFMVSKYYKEPIADAVLCNGGQVNGDAYPELADVLGTKYGGTIGFDTINSQYGITSSTGYPQAYNPDLDMYVYSDGKSVVKLYKKGQAVQTLTLPQTGAGGVYGTNYFLYPFRQHIIISYLNTGGTTTLMYEYNINTSSWTKLNSSAPFNHTYYMWMTDLGDYFLYRRGYPYPILVDKDTLAQYNASYRLNNSTITLIDDSGQLTVFGQDDYVYLSAYDNTNGTRIFRFRKDSVNAENLIINLELVRTVGGGVNIGTGSPGRVYHGSYIYQVSGANLVAYLVSTGTYTILHSFASSTNAPGRPCSAIPMGEGFVYTFSTGANTDTYAKLYYYIIGTQCSTGTFYPGFVSSELRTSQALTSTSGVKNNFRIQTFQLPTITQSEALVYMRTKTPKKEA